MRKTWLLCFDWRSVAYWCYASFSDHNNIVKLRSCYTAAVSSGNSWKNPFYKQFTDYKTTRETEVQIVIFFELIFCLCRGSATVCVASQNRISLRIPVFTEKASPHSTEEAQIAVLSFLVLSFPLCCACTISQKSHSFKAIWASTVCDLSVEQRHQHLGGLYLTIFAIFHAHCDWLHLGSLKVLYTRFELLSQTSLFNFSHNYLHYFSCAHKSTTLRMQGGLRMCVIIPVWTNITSCPSHWWRFNPDWKDYDWIIILGNTILTDTTESSQICVNINNNMFKDVQSKTFQKAITMDFLKSLVTGAWWTW